MNTSFWKAGHAPTLFAAFLYFDLSFMVWYVLGPLGVQIASDLGLTTQQRAMMVATPILAGAVLSATGGYRMIWLAAAVLVTLAAFAVMPVKRAK